VISSGEVQRISSGVGISHSEYNFSPDATLRFLQIWIEPHGQNLQPHYAKQFFSMASRQNQLCLVVSPDGRTGSLDLNQDVFIYTTLLRKDISVHYTQATKRVTYIHIAKGEAAINNDSFNSGDGAVVHHEKEVTLNTATSAEVLLFDLPYYYQPTT
jgi:redox-sensitive bicupin YhaK (pirin superfamily)